MQSHAVSPCDLHPNLARRELPVFPPISIDPAHPTAQFMELLEYINPTPSVSADNRTSCIQWWCTSKPQQMCQYCFPYVMIVGMSKCGTSALFDKLISHPSLKAYWEKEVYVFSRRMMQEHFRRNMSNFESLLGPYDPNNLNRLFLDGSAGVARDLQSIALIQRYSPRTKIIIMVRDFYARFISWLAMVAHDNHATDIEAFSQQYGTHILDILKQVAGGITNEKILSTDFIHDINFFGPIMSYFMTGHMILPWVQAFGDNILVLDHADLLSDPLSTLRRIESFLDIPPHQYRTSVLRSHTNQFGNWGHHIHSNTTAPKKKAISFGKRRDVFLNKILTKSACVMEKLVGWVPKSEVL